MVSTVRLSLIALVLVACAYIVVEAKDCYMCENKTTCADNSTITTKECPNDCIKVENSKGQVMIKGCTTQEICDIYRYCYLCKDDKCNSSSSISPSFVIMGIVGAIVAKYYM